MWIVPLHGGGPWKLSTLAAHSARWSPDGKNLAYASGNRIYLAAQDGSSPRALGSWKGVPEKLNWSPDGQRLRFLLVDPASRKSSFWELTFRDELTNPTLSSLPLALDDCCATWSQVRGKDVYLLIPSIARANQSIWILRAERSIWEPAMRVTELHTGLSEITAASYSSSAQRLYVISHVPSRSSLLRFDAQTGEFRHVLPGVSGVSLDYSKDRQWVTYTSSEDDSLWVSRADGGGARELVHAPEGAELPRWSPDGQWIAYMARRPGSPWRICLSRALEAQSARRRKATILKEPPLGRLMEIILSMEMSGVRQRALRNPPDQSGHRPRSNATRL